MLDSSALHMVLPVLTGCLERREREAMAYLIEENRLLLGQLGSRRQGLDNRLIAETPTLDRTGRVRRRPRLGGRPNFYERVA